MKFRTYYFKSSENIVAIENSVNLFFAVKKLALPSFDRSLLLYFGSGKNALKRKLVHTDTKSNH